MTALSPSCARHAAEHRPLSDPAPRVLTFAVVKRIDPRLPNTWGHWWIELNGKESYGWWPDPCPMGWRGALLGTGGALNGIGTTAGATTARDAYHGDEPDHWFHPTLLVDRSDEQVCADIRAFAHSYHGGFRWQWWWLRQPGENCRTFQDELFEAVGLREEPDHLYTRGPGCPFMYPFRLVKWRAIDTATSTVAHIRCWAALRRRSRGARDHAGNATHAPPRPGDQLGELVDPKARARARIRGTTPPARGGAR